MTEHTVKAFDADLAELVGLIGELRDLTQRQLTDGVEAFVGQDLELAAKVIALHDSNETMQRKIEAAAILTIARRQPVAHDLRLIIAIWEVAIELGRIGELGKSIAECTAALGGQYRISRSAKGLRRVVRVASRRLQQAVSSLTQADAAAVRDLWGADQEIDDLYSSLCREILTYTMAETSPNPSTIHLLVCAQNVARVGDHIANITDAAHYLVHGRRIDGSVRHDMEVPA